MANASADQNFVRAKMGVLNTDGVTCIPITINESNGGMMIDTVSTISFTMTPIAPGDANYEKVLLWEGTDGLTYPWVVNSSGGVLISTT